MLGKTKQFLNKERQIADTEASIYTLLEHARVNFTYGLCSGVTIAFIGIFIVTGDGHLKTFGLSWDFLSNMFWVTLQLFVSYVIYNKVESKVFNREKYKSKFAIKYIYPIPKTFGLLVGCFISLLIKYYL